MNFSDPRWMGIITGVAVQIAIMAVWCRRRGYEKALGEEVAKLQVQLAGCSVAAMGWDKGNEPKRGDYGWSQSYEDVSSLRKRYEELRKTGEALGLAVVDGELVVCRPIDEAQATILKRITQAMKDLGHEDEGDHPTRPWHEIPKPDSEPHY